MSPSHQLPVKSALICGASQGIGLALTRQLIEDPSYSSVVATYRDLNSATDLLALHHRFPKKLQLRVLCADQPEHFESLGLFLKEQFSQLHLCINVIGTLTDTKTWPERKIEEVTSEALNWSFQVNTVPSLLLAKAVKDLIQKSEKPIFAAVSAKVGSINDNRTGGWYSYRISKAALNMAIKTLSIEFKRLNRNSLVVALHPGTTHTRLSKPFIALASKKYIVHQPEETARHLLKVLFSLSPSSDNGSFYSWDGQKLPW